MKPVRKSKKVFAMKSLRKYRCVIAALVAVASYATQPLRADDKFRAPMPPMPRIVLPAPPPMIWLPTPKIHVAYDSPYPIFHHEQHYYLHHENVWYLGPSHNGPWQLIKGKQVPKNLRKFKKDKWSHYQRDAARHFRENREDRRHHHFYADRPHERASWNDYERRSRNDRGRRDERYEQRGGEHDDRNKKDRKNRHND